MDLVDQLRAFVATAQTGSFTAAAHQLGVSNRLTSKYVAELEGQMGVRLLQRTTRKVGLTPAGEDLLARAPALLDDLDDLFSEVRAQGQGLSGLIRVSAPVTLGEMYISGLLGRFKAAHPQVSFDLRLSDAFTDLASEGIDVAFRVGESQNLSLKSRKIAMLDTVLVASPDYVATHGEPKTHENLSDHVCIVDTNRRNPKSWPLRVGDELEFVPVSGDLMVNSARGAAELAKQGHGISHTLKFVVQDDLEQGALVPILTEYSGLQSGFHAVYLEGRVLSKKVRALIDFAVADVRQFGIA